MIFDAIDFHFAFADFAFMLPLMLIFAMMPMALSSLLLRFILR